MKLIIRIQRKANPLKDVLASIEIEKKMEKLHRELNSLSEQQLALLTRARAGRCA